MKNLQVFARQMDQPSQNRCGTKYSLRLLGREKINLQMHDTSA
jgi:hypothetical protein